jgi:hypothetical protein
MKCVSIGESVDLVARLYDTEFSGKPRGRLRIARATLAMATGRKNIEQFTVGQISLELSERHDLLFIDLHDEFAVLKTSILRRYRKATDRVVKEILGIDGDDDTADDDEE